MSDMVRIQWSDPQCALDVHNSSKGCGCTAEDCRGIEDSVVARVSVWGLQTPRWGIESRLFAMFCFETGAGCFRMEWSRRARKKDVLDVDDVEVALLDRFPGPPRADAPCPAHCAWQLWAARPPARLASPRRSTTPRRFVCELGGKRIATVGAFAGLRNWIALAKRRAMRQASLHDFEHVVMSIASPCIGLMGPGSLSMPALPQVTSR